jgi:replicative DNA helicase
MIESEKTILAHCLRWPSIIETVMLELGEDDFTSPDRRILFKTFRDMERRGLDRLDPIATSQATIRQGTMIPVSELVDLEDSFAIDGINIEYHVREIKASSQRRKLSLALEDGLKALQDPANDLNPIRQALAEKLMTPWEVSGQSKILAAPDHYRSEILNLVDGKSEDRGLLTGWPTFDELLGGLRFGELTVLTGETSSGKTTWGVNLCYRLAKNGVSCLIASFEMLPAKIITKMIQAESCRPMIDHNELSVLPYLDRIEKLPIRFVNVYGELGISKLAGIIRRAKAESDIKVALLDHLHFFLKFQPDHERIAIDQAVRELKSLAMELAIHILLVVHPTKIETENRPIRLNDLKGSSGLKQVPDNVLSLWRSRNKDDLKKPQNEIILYVLKVRDDSGDEGKIILMFDKRSQSYSDSGPGSDAPAEGKGIPHSSPRSRTPERNWADGYDN